MQPISTESEENSKSNVKVSKPCNICLKNKILKKESR